MQAVPDISVGQALGMSRATRLIPDDPDDEVDERIRGQSLSLIGGVVSWYHLVVP